MKIAMLFANWIKYGEQWSTPMTIVDELTNRGHEVTIYNLYHADGWMSNKEPRKYSDEGFNKLYQDSKNNPYDVIMVMDYGPWQSFNLNKKNFPNSILIKECGDEPQAYKLHSQTARLFDIVLTPDYRCAQHYIESGINAKFWTHWANDLIFKEYPDIQPVFDCVTTCGGRGPITEILAKEPSIKFNNERYFYGHDHAQRFNMGKLVFQKSQHGEITRRVFEGMACKRAVITDRLAENTLLSSLFKENESIIFYDSPQDAIEKIKYYSNNEAERNRIAINGYNEVMQKHTTKNRVDQLEQYIFEKIES